MLKKYSFTYTSAAVCIAAGLLLSGCPMGISEKTRTMQTGDSGLVQSGQDRQRGEWETDVQEGSGGTVHEGYSIVKTVDYFNPVQFEKLNGSVVSSITLSGGYRYFLVHTTGNARHFRSLVRQYSGVVYAQPDYRYDIPAVTEYSAYSGGIGGCGAGQKALKQSFCPAYAVQKTTAIPYGTQDGNVQDDPKADMLDWGLTATHALEAFQQYDSKAVHPVIAAIIDTGVNSLHEDFYDEQGSSIILYAKSTLPKGKNHPASSPDPIPLEENWDNVGHGTHCAGTIAAVGNNGKGICGVSHTNTRLITYRGIDLNGASEFATYSCLGDLADIVTELRKEPQDRNTAVFAGLPETVRNYPKIEQKTVPVNMSFGGGFINLFEIEMTNKALAAGILPVIAMGNDGKTIAAFPAANQGVLAVGATDRYDERASFSNGGSWMSVCAPGKSIFSCGNGGDKWNNPADSAVRESYAWMSGTSMAAPFVTGTIAYILSINPQLTPYQVKTLLESTADKIDAGDSEYGRYDSRGHSKWYGFGRVNVLNAARKAAESPLAGSVYSEKAVRITVKRNGIPVKDLHVWVYEPASGAALAGLTNAQGLAEFRGLRIDTKYEIGVTVSGTYRTYLVTPDTERDTDYTFDF